MLEIYRLEQSEKWDDIVRSFNDYDVYWLSGYVKAFKIHGDGDPLLFFYDSDGTRGINIVMMRDIAKDSLFISKIREGCYYDFATPYGYGGWLIEGNDRESLFSAYNEWVSRNGIISEFVRFHPMLNNHVACANFYDIIQLGEVVHMDLNSPGEIWNNMTSKNRNSVRKALKNGVRIYNGRFPKIFDIFKSIYKSTMEKDRADDYYYFQDDFFYSILMDLPQNAQVFWAEKDDIVIAASIMLFANGRMNYHLSGSLQEYSYLAPVNLLLYSAALWGYANGYDTFYLGGGIGSNEDGLFKFKKAFFKGDLGRFYIGKKIYRQEKYENLVDIRGQISSSFFPLYRALH